MTTVKSISTPRTPSSAVTVSTPVTLRRPARNGYVKFRQSLRRQSERCGVTLVELLLVLSLLLVMMSIALPGVRRWQRLMPLEQAVSLLQLQLQETRVAAIRSGEAWCLVLPSAGSPGRRHPLNERQAETSRFQFRMPAGVRCDVLASPTGHLTGNPSDPGRIVFHADGTVEQTCVRIVTEDGGVTTLKVNRLTGTATIVQSSGGTHAIDRQCENSPGVPV